MFAQPIFYERQLLARVGEKPINVQMGLHVFRCDCNLSIIPIDHLAMLP